MENSDAERFMAAARELFDSNVWDLPSVRDFYNRPETLSVALIHLVEEIGEANKALRERDARAWEEELTDAASIIVHLLALTTNVSPGLLFDRMTKRVALATGKRKHRRMP